MIPREEIDKGILTLVESMNKYEGVKTIMSCEGHSDKYPESYIRFKVDSLNNLNKFLDILEEVRGRYFEGNRPIGGVTINVITNDSEPSFFLRISHENKNIQKELINEVEKCLLKRD